MRRCCGLVIVPLCREVFLCRQQATISLVVRLVCIELDELNSTSDAACRRADSSTDADGICGAGTGSWSITRSWEVDLIVVSSIYFSFPLFSCGCSIADNVLSEGTSWEASPMYKTVIYACIGLLLEIWKIQNSSSDALDADVIYYELLSTSLSI